MRTSLSACVDTPAVAEVVLRGCSAKLLVLLCVTVSITMMISHHVIDLF